MSEFGPEASLGYDRRAAPLLRGLYRRIGADAAARARRGAAVLDVGTGPGRLPAEMARRRPDLDLHGVDLSPHMIALAGPRLAGTGADLRTGDVADLPYPDGRFDLVVSSLSLHEWPDVRRAAAELARVLAPGGALLLYDFRFVRTGAALAALRAALPGGRVRRTAVRPALHPVAVFTRLTAEPG